MKWLQFVLPLVLAFFPGVGCDKSSPKAAERPIPYSLASQTIAHLHWLGKNHLATDTSAAGLMHIWNQSESVALEAHALDKLSTAPWRLLPHVATTNYAAGAPLLRVLLDDCVQRESYLEVRAATNQPGEIAFAIRLPADQAALWQTNLGEVLESLTGIHPEATEKGWCLTKHDLPNRIELNRVGEWVVVGIGQDRNALVGDFVARVLKKSTPVTTEASSFWVDLSVDPTRVVNILGLPWELPSEITRISTRVMGAGQEMQTQGSVEFTTPPGLMIAPWNFPTNLMRERLLSFTALRGIAPFLDSTKVWQELKIGPAPDQFFGWSSRDIPLQILFAAHSDDPTNTVKLLAELLKRFLEPKLAANKSGRLEATPEFQGLRWAMIPFATPFVQARDSFIFAGLLPNDGSGVITKMPPAMLQILSQTNLVYYDWEATGPRMDVLFQATQLGRLLFRKAQLLPESPGMGWMLANTTNVGNTVTTAFQTPTGQIAFIRRSTVGFAAGEMHLLADWLASPDFPARLNTFRSQSSVSQKLAQPVSGTPSRP